MLLSKQASSLGAVHFFARKSYCFEQIRDTTLNAMHQDVALYENSWLKGQINSALQKNESYPSSLNLGKSPIEMIKNIEKTTLAILRIDMPEEKSIKPALFEQRSVGPTLPYIVHSFFRPFSFS
jgi:hypothetical protein